MYGVSAGCNVVISLCKRFVTCFLKHCLPAAERDTQSFRKSKFLLAGFCLIGWFSSGRYNTLREMVSKPEGWVFFLTPQKKECGQLL